MTAACPAAAQRQQAELLLLAEACLAALTPRECVVLGLLAIGQTDRQIAERLGVAHRTATTHVGRVLAKLGLRSRAAAASLAVRAASA